MTVAELIKELKKYDRDLPVVIWHHDETTPLDDLDQEWINCCLNGIDYKEHRAVVLR